MVREHYTATVREDSKGQKTVTIPKSARIEGGDKIKLKKTKKWGFNEVNEAINKAKKEAAKHWYDKDDELAPEDVTFTTYNCEIGEGRDVCMWSELRESDMKEHLEEVHDIEEPTEDHYFKQEHISLVDLSRMFPLIIQNLDIENRELYADEVADKIEEIVTHDRYTEPIKLEKLHDYADKIRDKELETEPTPS